MENRQKRWSNITVACQGQSSLQKWVFLWSSLEGPVVVVVVVGQGVGGVDVHNMLITESQILNQG